MAYVLKSLGKIAVPGVALLSFLACGRTPLLPPQCDLVISPTALDFGSVVPGQAATGQVAITNRGIGECHLANLGASPTSDPSFTITPPDSMVIAGAATVAVTVTFQPEDASIPLQRTGALTFDVDALSLSHAQVPLLGTIRSDCHLAVSPLAIDFGHVALDSWAQAPLLLTNTGTGPCQVGSLAIAPGSDPGFAADRIADPLKIAPGEQQVVSVRYTATDPAPPHHRTGSLGFASNDNAKPQVKVPLAVDIDIGCELTWTPLALDFGNVNFNTRASRDVSLGNDGSDACQVSSIGFTPDSDANFALTSASALTVVPGQTAVMRVTFSAVDSASPHLKTGSLVFQTGNRRNPSGKVPLSAVVNTACVDASRWIYTLDGGGVLARFDPTALSFTTIATLKCPGSSSPNSMAVDQQGVAWVGYQDGNLYKVDTATGACQATSFQVGQDGITVFGMGFVFDPATGKDTLYIAGGGAVMAGPSTLATVSFPSLVATRVGAVAEGFPELTGTGDGQLWGFIPNHSSATGDALLLRLDPKSAKTLETYSYPTLTSGGAWAVKFWGGAFWIFLGNAVYKVSRESPAVVETVIANTGRGAILGAGVSTCAPLQ